MYRLFAYLDVYKLRHATHVEYHGDVVALLVKTGPGAIGAKTLSDEYGVEHSREVSIFEVVRKSELTGKIEELDHQRDDLFRGLVKGIESNLLHFDANRRDAAHALMIVIEHYGNLPSRSYDDQASLTTDLCAELSTPAHAARIATLGYTTWLEKLAEVNNAFITTMRERYEEVSQRPATSMKEAREAVDKVYHAILNRLEAIATLNGIDSVPELAPFVAELNAITNRYKNVLAAERGRRAANKAGGNNEENGEGNEE